MPVISLINEKGGAGKTTISTNVARGLQLAGHSVMLVDADPQGSARDWYAASGEDSEMPPVVGLDRPELFRQLAQITAGYDWVVIDGAPQVREMSVAALKASDGVLIPVQPSPYDVWSTESLVELIQSRQEVTEGRPKASFIVSRQIVGTKLAGEVRAALDGYELPIMAGYTSQRVSYSQSASEGRTVLDGADKAASGEVQAIVSEVQQWL